MVTLDTTRRLRLSKHAELKTRAEGDILVLPEQAIRLGGSGGEILRLVSRGETAASITATLLERYPDSAEVASEVRQFLEAMLANGGILHSGASDQQAENA